jgi:hypothetical protein
VKSIYVAVLIFVFALRADAIYLSDEKVNFYLPNNWMEAPKDVLSQEQKKMEQVMPKETFAYSHLYQLEGADWFSYPYILVETQNGRVPDSQLSYSDITQALHAKKGELPSVMQNVQYGDTHYDPNMKKVWLDQKLELPGGTGGGAYAVLLMLATEEKFIRFTFACTMDQYDQYHDLFVKIADSVRPDPSVAYKAAPWDQRPAWEDWVIKWGGIILALVVAAWIRRRFFKKNS